MLGLKMQNNANLFSHQLDDKNQRKKIEDYSYGLHEKIGKGYSSIVYKGRNDITGNKHLLVGIPTSTFFILVLFRLNRCHQGY